MVLQILIYETGLMKWVLRTIFLKKVQLRAQGKRVLEVEVEVGEGELEVEVEGSAQPFVSSNFQQSNN